MTQHKLSALLAEKKVALGLWLNLLDPDICLIYDLAGIDWIMVDTEHNPFTERDIHAIIGTVRDREISCIVRVRANDPGHIKWVLDAGADGIIVPMLDSAGDAAKAVRAAKYWPVGQRGYCPLRATEFWRNKQIYDDRANKDILLIAMVERPGMVRDINEVAQMPGIDAIWIGPDDLSHSMGYLKEPGNHAVLEAFDKVIEAANREKKPWGIPVGDPATLLKYVSRGGVLMTIGTASSLLTKAVKERTEACREILRAGKLRAT